MKEQGGSLILYFDWLCLLLNPSGELFMSVNYSSAPKFLFCSVLYFLFLKFSIYSCIISLSLLSIFMMVTLNSSSDNSYTSILYGWFSGIYFVPLIGSFPPVSSCSMLLWICIYPFKTIATSPSLLWAGSIQGKIFTNSLMCRFWRPLKPFLWMFLLLTCVCRFLMRGIFQFPFFFFFSRTHNFFVPSDFFSFYLWNYRFSEAAANQVTSALWGEQDRN